MLAPIILAATVGFSPDLDSVSVVQPWPRLAMAETQGDGVLPVGDPADHHPKPKPKKHHKHYCPPTCMPCDTCVPHPKPCPPKTTCAPPRRRLFRKCCPPPHPCPPPTPHTTCAPPPCPPPCPPPMPHTTCAPPRPHGCFLFRRIW